MLRSANEISTKFLQVKKLMPFPFRQFTTVGIGGDAPLAFFPRDFSTMIEIVSYCRKEQIPFFVLGRGSNVLTSDAGFDGVVLCTHELDQVQVCDGWVDAYCGANIGKMLSEVAKRGMGGLAFLAGIPASLGGAIYMNAGACGTYIESVVTEVTIFDGGGLQKIDVSECNYSYKRSRFMWSNEIILGARLRLQKTGKEKALREIRDSLRARAQLPTGKSLGCVFMNPDQVSAGYLIERSGLKGVCCGDAKISEEHANFIVNMGHATAEEYKKLIQMIKERVFSETGVVLREEIRYIGEF